MTGLPLEREDLFQKLNKITCIDQITRCNRKGAKVLHVRYLLISSVPCGSVTLCLQAMCRLMTAGKLTMLYRWQYFLLPLERSLKDSMLTWSVKPRLCRYCLSWLPTPHCSRKSCTTLHYTYCTYLKQNSNHCDSFNCVNSPHHRSHSTPKSYPRLIPFQWVYSRFPSCHIVS